MEQLTQNNFSIALILTSIAPQITTSTKSAPYWSIRLDLPFTKIVRHLKSCTILNNSQEFLALSAANQQNAD